MALKYALARMGKEKYFNEIVNRKQKYFLYRYINTQEAYWKYIENYYYFDELRSCLSEGEWPKGNSASYVISSMSTFILNTPKELNTSDSFDCFRKDELEEGMKKVKKAYEWYKGLSSNNHLIFFKKLKNTICLV